MEEENVRLIWLIVLCGQKVYFFLNEKFNQINSKGQPLWDCVDIIYVSKTNCFCEQFWTKLGNFYHCKLFHDY